MALLEVRNATKLYGEAGAPVRALDNVSFELASGAFAALVGRSGCGKSTLLNLCGAMDFPNPGSVVIDGQDTARLNDAALTRIRREKIGFVFQSFQLLHTLTALENVELPLLLGRRDRSRAAALERLQWVDLVGLENRYPHQLSGGQQQRVAIARALASNPRLLLADEPTGNLDSSSGEIILDLLARSTREFGTTVLMATHSAESLAVVDSVIRMRDGRISTVEEVRRPESVASI